MIPLSIQTPSFSEKIKTLWAQNDGSEWTATQVQIYAWRSFALLSTASAGVIVTLAACHVVALSVACVAIPLGLFGGLSFLYSMRIDDYEDGDQLAQFREQALHMSLDEVANRHGWREIFTYQLLKPEQFESHYRQQVQGKTLRALFDYYEKVRAHVAAARARPSYLIPHPRECKEKWHQETQDKTFAEILQAYDLDKIQRYGIVEQEEFQHLKELAAVYQRAKGVYQVEEAHLKEGYTQATRVERSACEEKCRLADQAYGSHWAVREERGLNDRILRERVEIDNAKNISLLAAQKQFSLYQKLPPADRAQHAQEHHRAVTQADTTAATRLREAEQRYADEKARLKREMQSAEESCSSTKREAQRSFEEETAPATRAYAEALAPHQATFQRIQNDLTQRYKVYRSLL